jgi:hypothetical protein
MNKFLMRNMGTIASLVVLLAPVVAMSATGLDAGADDAFKGTYIGVRDYFLEESKNYNHS